MWPQNDPGNHGEVDQEKGSCPQCSYDLTFNHSSSGLTWSFSEFEQELTEETERQRTFPLLAPVKFSGSFVRLLAQASARRISASPFPPNHAHEFVHRAVARDQYEQHDLDGLEMEPMVGID